MKSIKSLLASIFLLGMTSVLHGSEQTMEVSRWVEFLTQRPQQLRSYDERKAFGAKLPALSSTSARAVLERVVALQVKAIKDGSLLDVDFPALIRVLQTLQPSIQTGPGGRSRSE